MMDNNTKNDNEIRKMIKDRQDISIAELKDAANDKTKHLVLLITSYCSDNNNCTDAYPCVECLKMSNIVAIDSSCINDGVICGYEFL